MYSLTNGASSETIEDFADLDEYVPLMELKHRIYKARKDANMTQDQLASAVDKTRGAVAQWESGDVRPRHSTLVKIAEATNKPIGWLESGGTADDEGSGVRLPVVGDVSAGLWREATLTYEQHFEPVAPHPDYPAASQRLYRVSGTSINKIASNGEYLHAVNVHGGGVTPENGDLVIVCRMQHGLAEYTAKTLIADESGQALRPESLDPDWQMDIKVNGDDDTSIEITDVVIAKWSPIERRRKTSR